MFITNDVRLALHNLVQHGHRPGGFLEALVAGDLELARARADPHSCAHFEDIVRHVHIYVLVMQRIVDSELAAAAGRKL